MTGKTNKVDDTKEAVVKNPFEWLLRTCLLLLGCAILLTLTINLLANIWPWVLALGLAIAVVAGVIRIASDRRRKW